MGPGDLVRPGRISLMFYQHKEAGNIFKEWERILPLFDTKTKRFTRTRGKKRRKRKASEMEDNDNVDNVGGVDEVIVHGTTVDPEEGEIVNGAYSCGT